MSMHRFSVSLLAMMVAGSATGSLLNAADSAADEHAGHDHGPAPAAGKEPAPAAKKKPHVHGAHEEEEEEEEGAGHDDHAGHAEDDHHAEGSGSEEIRLPRSSASAFGIVSEPAQARALAAMILAPGWVVYDPAGQAQVATPAAGRIMAIHVQVGDVVQAGAPLVDLLSPAYVDAQNLYLLKRAAAQAAALLVESSSATLVRGQQAGEGISGAELKRRENDAKQAAVVKLVADAELAAALGSVRLLSPNADDLEALGAKGTVATTLVLRAPRAGTVTALAAVSGQQVGPDAPPLITIADPSRLWVVANVPEAQVAQVSVGSLAELYAFTGELLGDGDIAGVSPDIDPHTRSGRVRLAIAGTSTIRPGMYVQVHLTPLAAETGATVIAVPESAVMTIAGRTVVFIAEPAGEEIHFHVQPVLIGRPVGGLVPILTGLEAGTPVVVKGTFLLKADLGKEGAEHEH